MLLIDSDSTCYAAAFNAVGMGEEYARNSLNNMLEDILVACNDQEHRLFLSGKDNFRYKIYSNYKANRIGVEKPEYLQACREHLISAWGAKVSEGIEADDDVGIAHYALDCTSTVVSLDKDLLQFSGINYNPRSKVRTLISPFDGLKFLYTQMLQGDTADNVPGRKGIGKIKAAKLTAYAETEEELFNIVRDCYGNDEEFLMNAQCLYLWRKENDDIQERWKDFGWDYTKSS